jgi:hypothetical protein
MQLIPCVSRAHDEQVGYKSINCSLINFLFIYQRCLYFRLFVMISE